MSSFAFNEIRKQLEVGIVNSLNPTPPTTRDERVPTVNVGNGSRFPLAFENFTDDAFLKKAKKDQNSFWGRFVIRDGESSVISLGGESQRRRFTGVGILSIFGPAGIGTQRFRDIASVVADSIVKYYPVVTENNTETQLRVYSAQVQVVGDSEAGIFQLNLQIPFEFDMAGEVN